MENECNAGLTGRPVLYTEPKNRPRVKIRNKKKKKKKTSKNLLTLHLLTSRWRNVPVFSIHTVFTQMALSTHLSQCTFFHPDGATYISFQYKFFQPGGPIYISFQYKLFHPGGATISNLPLSIIRELSD